MTPEEIKQQLQDDETLWVWKSKKGYWNSKRERWAENKQDCQPIPWRRCKIVLCIGEGIWEEFETTKTRSG